MEERRYAGSDGAVGLEKIAADLLVDVTLEPLSPQS